MCVVLAVPAPRTLAATVPAGFQETLVVDGLTAPAALAFSPDGRLFVAEQTTGKLKVVKNGAATTFLDVNAVVPSGTQFDSYFERGLLGVAFDPDFATNGFVYLYHTLCNQPPSQKCIPSWNTTRPKVCGDANVYPIQSSGAVFAPS